MGIRSRVFAGAVTLATIIILPLTMTTATSSVVQLVSTANADTYTVSNNDVSHGDWTTLGLSSKSVTGVDRRIYLNFAVTKPSSKSVLTRALLWMLPLKDGSDVEVYSTGSFNEAGLKYSNRPALGAKLGESGAFKAATKPLGFDDIYGIDLGNRLDLTSTSVNLALETRGGYTEFQSREEAGLRPSLILQFDDQTGTTHTTNTLFPSTTSTTGVTHTTNTLFPSTTSTTGVTHTTNTLFPSTTSTTGVTHTTNTLFPSTTSTTGLTHTTNTLVSTTSTTKKTSPTVVTTTTLAPTTTTIPKTVPGAPTALAATGGLGQASLSWAAPSNNGGASITDYVIEYKTSSASAWTVFADGTTNAQSATVSGLANGTSYNFQVSAVNSVGKGAASSVANATTTTPATTTTSTLPTTGGGCTSGANGNEIFHTSGTTAWCNSSGQSVVLNGFNIRNPENTEYTTSAQFKKMHDKGFNVVRIAMQWQRYETSKGVFSETQFKTIRDAITNAKANGVYVILDPIHYSGTGQSCSGSGCIPTWATGSGNDETIRIGDNAQAYLQKVAKELGNDSNVIAIDLANEVQPLNYDDDDTKLIAMYNRLAEYVRNADPDKILMFEGARGDDSYSSTGLQGIAYKTNMIYSWHFYYGGPGNYTGGGGDPYDGNKAGLESKITASLNRLKASNVNLPLFIGEYGITEGADKAAQWRTDITSIFKKYNISRTYWVYYNEGSAPGKTCSDGSIDPDGGDCPNEELSATYWSDNGDTPGAFKSWIDQIL